jgi:hypothetical protein
MMNSKTAEKPKLFDMLQLVVNAGITQFDT